MYLQQLEKSLRELEIELPSTPQSVLLVDDEPENLEVLAALLEDAYVVRVARDGFDALGMLESGPPPDLVIADQRMPRMTGLELLTRVAERFPDTLRMVLTAYGDVEPMMDAINHGSVHRFLLKNSTPEQIRGAVGDALRAKRSAALLKNLVEALGRRKDALDQTLRRLKAARDQLLAAERIGTFGRAASGILHSLENLTTVTSRLVDRVARETVDPALVHSASQVVANLSALAEPLEMVRDFARANDGSLNLVWADTEEFLSSTVALARLEADGGRCPIHVKVARDARTLTIDTHRMRQAVVALLNNALRASPPGAPIELVVRKVQPGFAKGPRFTNPPKRWVYLEVVDRGSGMDETTLTSVTKPLYSGFSPRGLGLGLEMARVTAHAHGGRLELCSGPGHGTRASMVFPDVEVASC
jgi:signal transduction histidine kinase